MGLNGKKRSGSNAPGNKPVKKQKLDKPAAEKPAKDSADASKKDSEDSDAKKSGIMYQVNLKYAELTNTKKERNATMLIEQIIEMVRASKMPVLQVGTSGDGSRAFQACLKWGDRRHRDQILELFADCVPELVESEKGGALVQKLLRYCPKVLESGTRNADGTRKQAGKAELALQTKIVERIVAPVADLKENKLTKLFFSKFGCKNLDAVLNAEHVRAKWKNRVLNTIQIPKKLRLLEEDYKQGESVRNFEKAILKKGGETLTQFRTHLDEVVDRIVDKELLDRPITHSLLALHARLLEADSANTNSTGEQGATLMREFVEKRLPIDACPHLLQTKCGVEALMRYLGYFSAKQKKTIVKLLKGKFLDMANNNVCYLLVMRLLQVVDDTVMSQKQILQELLEKPAEPVERKGDEKLEDGFEEKAEKAEADAPGDGEGDEEGEEESGAETTKQPSSEDVADAEKHNLSPLARLLDESTFARKVVYSVLETPVSRYYGPSDMEGCFGLPTPTALKDPAKRRAELRQFLLKPLLTAIDELGWMDSLNVLFLKDIALHFVCGGGDAQLEKVRSQKVIIEENVLGGDLEKTPESILDLVRGKPNRSLSFVVMQRNNREFSKALWDRVLSKVPVEKVRRSAKGIFTGGRDFHRLGTMGG